MADNKLNEIMRDSLSKIKELVDVNTIIGNPITTNNGTVIIPVSKVSLGFVSGGVDYFGKNAPAKADNNSFGGGGGTGVTVAPLGFLVVNADGDVTMLDIGGNSTPPDTAETIANVIENAPDIIRRIKELFGKKKPSDEPEDPEPTDTEE